MNDHHTHRSWRRKFADAFRGVALGVRGQSSFFVHFSVAVAVGLAAAVLQVSRIGWCVLAICIAAVLTASGVDNLLAEVGGEIALTVHAGCTRDDFHNWNYDHLEFIIDLSNRHNFDIPKNFLNGLPEQLIILVDSEHVKKPRCDT